MTHDFEVWLGINKHLINADVVGLFEDSLALEKIIANEYLKDKQIHEQFFGIAEQEGDKIHGSFRI